MAEIGYALSSEEHSPNDLVKNARRAEEAGFTFALISDHYHPWIEEQGHSPFVWSVIGGIAAATQNLRLGTGVTAPIMRIHPAIIAQAAATSAAMMPGRFFLGVGTGEALNEHILADAWPEAKIRIQMLDEAIEVMRELWSGKETSFYGDFYVVDRARLFTLPDEPVQVYYAASGEKSAEHGGEIGDGFISTSPKKELIEAFDRGGGAGKPKIGKATVCYAESEEKALDTVFKYWRQSPLPEPLGADLPTVDHFEAAAELVTREQIREKFILGPDPQKFIDHVQEFLDAGFDHVYLHQIGPEQEGFLRFAERELLPQLKGETHRMPR